MQPDGGHNIHEIAHPFLVVEVADSQWYEEAITKAEHFLLSKVRGLRVRFVIVINLVRKSWKQRRHESTGYDDASAPEDKDDNEARSEQIDIDLPLQERTVRDGISNVEEHIIVTDTTAPRLQSNKRIVDHSLETSGKRHRSILLTSSPPAAISLGTKDAPSRPARQRREWGHPNCHSGVIRRPRKSGSNADGTTREILTLQDSGWWVATTYSCLLLTA